MRTLTATFASYFMIMGLMVLTAAGAMAYITTYCQAENSRAFHLKIEDMLK